MAFDLSSITAGPRCQPPRIFLTGPHGIGKNTWAAGAPAPIFIQTEDGMGMLETPAFPLATTTAEVFEALNTLYSESHDFKTVVLDSADWLDNLIGKEIRANHDSKELAYGKDTLLIAEQWRLVLDWLNALRSKGMTTILLGHVEVKRYDQPDGDSYDRYQPKLTSRASAIVQEWADCVLFANWKTFVKTETVTTQKTVKKAISGGERLIHTGEKPAFLAKNRYSLPETLPMNWKAFADALPVPF
jgi:hypothetical protein